MSAFICKSDHLKALAAFCVDHHGGRGCRSMNVDPKYFRYQGGDPSVEGREPAEVASYYADLLYQENVRSVGTRYPRDSRAELPGPISTPEHMTVSELELAQFQRDRLPPVLILKMCDCLEYQSCETDDYQDTLAYRLLNAIRKAAIHQLPGYDDAPGLEYDRERVRTKAREASP